MDEKGNPLPKTGSPINFTVLGIAGSVNSSWRSICLPWKETQKSADKKE